MLYPDDFWNAFGFFFQGGILLLLKYLKGLCSKRAFSVGRSYFCCIRSSVALLLAWVSSPLDRTLTALSTPVSPPGRSLLGT